MPQHVFDVIMEKAPELRYMLEKSTKLCLWINQIDNIRLMMEPSTTTLATDGRFKRSVYSVSATNVRNL
jgi:hypothetical protein